MLTADELKASNPFQWLGRRYTPEVAERLLREFESVLLSKLRAPVADEWAAFEKWHVSDFGRRPVPFRQGDTARWEGWRGRAALASAPVAGEAHPPTRHCMCEDCAPSFSDAAPQASEAQCSCPSGDGSLRHPCAVHPQASEAVRDAAFEAVRKQLCKLPRYSFFASAGTLGGVRRVEDRSGNWIDFDAAHALFDPVSVDAALSAQPGAQITGGSE